MLRKGIDLEVPTNCPECPEHLLSKVELGFWVTLRLTLHIWCIMHCKSTDEKVIFIKDVDNI